MCVPYWAVVNTLIPLPEAFAVLLVSLIAIGIFNLNREAERNP